MRLRDTGCLNGVISDDMSVPVEELLARCKSWTIVGKDLIKEVQTVLGAECERFLPAHWIVI